MIAIRIQPDRLAAFRGESYVVVGSGKLKTKARPVLRVTSVTLSMSGNLRICLGVQDSLEVKAEDNLLGMIRTEVRNGTLVIYGNLQIGQSASESGRIQRLGGK